MTLTQYLRVLRQHWLLVLILAILGVAAAAVYTGRQTPVYQAQTQVFVSAQESGSRTSLAELSESSAFSQQRVKSYASMATSSAVTGPVVKELRLPYTTDQLASKIEAGPQLDTVLINISVSDTDPEQAAAIAKAVTDNLETVVHNLERANAQGRSPVKLTVTRPPTVPTAPVSPRVPLNIALGLLLGLGLGVGAAVLRDQLNTTLRGTGDVEQLTGSVPLGVVPFDASAPKQPLVTADAFGGRAEAFRTLRTNLQFADVDHPPRVIAVTSALPDEGKTTTACNIALILAQSGARVVLVEGDLRKPAVGRYLGISNAAGLTNVLAGQHDLRDVLVGYERDLLAVLPSGPTPPNPSELLGSQQMRHLLDTLAEHYDVVVIDAPPLLPVTDAALIATAADGAILVIRHGRSRREEAERALKSLEAVSAKVLGTVLNFAPSKKGRNGYQGYGYGYGQAPATASPSDDGSWRDSSRRGRRGHKPEPARPAEAPSGTSITLPPGDLPLIPGGSLPLEPLSSPDAGSPKPSAQPPAAAGPWAPDMGYAPSPSDGWAPIADSPGQRVPGPEAAAHEGLPAFGGLSSTGPLPVVTAPDDGPALVSRAEGLEVTRTAGEVPEELRLQSLPRDRAMPDTTPRRGPAGYTSPDTAPSGLPLGSRTGGIPTQPSQEDGERPGASWEAWDRTSWFDTPLTGETRSAARAMGTGRDQDDWDNRQAGNTPGSTEPRYAGPGPGAAGAGGPGMGGPGMGGPGMGPGGLGSSAEPDNPAPSAGPDGPGPSAGPGYLVPGAEPGTPGVGPGTPGVGPGSPGAVAGGTSALTGGTGTGMPGPTFLGRASDRRAADQQVPDRQAFGRQAAGGQAPDRRHHDPQPLDRQAPGPQAHDRQAHDRQAPGPQAHDRQAHDRPAGFPGDAGRETEPPEPEEIPPLLVDLSAPDLDLLEDERELLIPPQSVMPHMPTGVPRHHRSKRSL
ncbi:polysaccharide biosynthesis tyrosine autokinase [Kineosporia sp. J2-2]|uniref:non-specific protein-tyrosine kinase n=1 Tax=Kineosporia corallincola TaxID=2835133 RepID=A0ABS5TLX9_9ACTN|nr:polysaccharide biosynthesis tyrosine autokinase [Kineosporia corallincola]MBT0772112.1 polysaccharide biosynthesis tyrosine autokinase [Kineosporia corallincola]